jgi:hypothetical protein
MFKKLILSVILLASLSSVGCTSTIESDKKRIVIFTFGFGVAFLSDKELSATVEVKKSDKDKDTKEKKK